MKKATRDPFKNLVLDTYEQEIEKALEKGEYIPVEDEEVTNILDEAARNYPELEETRSITFRVKRMDLIKLKAKAEENNIPYQTLINLLIKSYTEGKTKLSL